MLQYNYTQLYWRLKSERIYIAQSASWAHSERYFCSSLRVSISYFIQYEAHTAWTLLHISTSNIPIWHSSGQIPNCAANHRYASVRVLRPVFQIWSKVLCASDFALLSCAFARRPNGSILLKLLCRVGLWQPTYASHGLHRQKFCSAKSCLCG